MSLAALIISVVALAFTFFTFWWLNWRPGKLCVSTPQTFAAHTAPDKLLLEFPFVFHNAGAQPIVVENLRLCLLDQKIDPLTFVATVDKLATADGRAFATAFPVPGRHAVRMVCEFHGKPAGYVLRAGKYTVQLDARLNGRTEWAPVHTFPLTITEARAAVMARAVASHENCLEP